MANTRAYNVHRIDTSGTTIAGPTKICSIHVHGTNPVVTIYKGANTSGSKIFECSAVGLYEVEIMAGQNIHITMSGTSPVAYIYIE